MVGVAPLRSGCALPLADVRGVAASSLASRQRRLGSGLVASGYACGAPAGRTARSADLHATAAAQLVGACSCSRHVALGPGAADAVPAHPRGGRVVARAVPRGGQGRYSGSSASSAAPSSGMADDRVRQRAQQVEAELRDLLGVHVPRLPLPGEKFSHLQCPYCGSENPTDKQFAVTITDEGAALFNCFRGKCGIKGKIFKGAVRVFSDGAQAVSSKGSSKPAPQRPAQQTPRVTAAAAAAGAGPAGAGDAPPGSAGEARLAELQKRFDSFHAFDDAAQPPPKEILEFIRARALSVRTLVDADVRWYAQPGAKDGPYVLAFPYTRDGRVVNIKHRTVAVKKFWMEGSGELLLWGLDTLGSPTEPGNEFVTIVEGEFDALALREAGVDNVLSVPNGAAAGRSGAAAALSDSELAAAEGAQMEAADRAFAYLWRDISTLRTFKSILIATDGDFPGHALAEELSRRLGKEKCWRAPFDTVGKPVTASSVIEQSQHPPPPPLKDANEALMQLGPQGLMELMQKASQPFPIEGLFVADRYSPSFWALFYGQDVQSAMTFGTGWDEMDELYRVVPGELTVVTGVPNSGKSEWIDALMVNLARQHGWSFALCSLENQPQDHMRKLAEKYTGKPLVAGARYAAGGPTMSEADAAAALEWIGTHFVWIRHEVDGLPSIEWVLEKAVQAVRRHGVRGLVIDPYNELEHQRPPGVTETNYVSNMLSRVKRFAQMHGVHVWFVAHPRQMYEHADEPPNLYDISGSSHWHNKADNGVVVHRYRRQERKDEVEVHVLKVRNKMAGRLGKMPFAYDARDGSYYVNTELLQETLEQDNSGEGAKRRARTLERGRASRLGNGGAAPAADVAPGGEDAGGGAEGGASAR